MRKLTIAIALATLPILSACAMGPKAFETEPVRVYTPQGYVYCQLYTYSSVTWDRAISHPQTMDLKEADKICFDTGYELAANR